MPGPKSSAEDIKGLSSTRRSIDPPRTSLEQPSDHQPTEHVNSAPPASIFHGDVSTLMSDRSYIATEGQSPITDPKLVAVTKSTPSPSSAFGKTHVSSLVHGEEKSFSSEREDSQGQDDGTGNLDPRPQKDATNQLSQYREQLARDMQRQGLNAKPGQVPAQVPAQVPKRVSPIIEESASNSPTPGQVMSGPSTASTNASTESGQTIRAGVTPAFVPKTPSYPFPRMNSGYLSSALHKPFTTLSPTGSAPDSPASSAAATATFGGTNKVHDRILSNPSTPASAIAFRPGGASQASQQGDFPGFPTPNLYDLSLMLTAEPGLEAWWRTVVWIMTDLYKAERLTLAVPADSTDLENVPWGQKATYNARLEDGLSMEYMARGSSIVPINADDASEPPSAAGDDAVRSPVAFRPGMSTRHSFTAYEDEKHRNPSGMGPPSSMPYRPGVFGRSQSFYPGSLRAERSQQEAMQAGLNQQALAEHDAEEQEAAEEWQAPAPEIENHGRVFELLQALDYEADPLIDHHGVTKVLERGRVIALTRSYPYPDDATPAKNPEPKGAGRSHSPEVSRKKGKRLRHESTTKLSSILGSAHSIKRQPHERKAGQQNIDQMISEGEPRRPPTPTYEEFEQAPPSPWSQSPAPSPAIRADPKDNPFFSDAGATVDESSFDPVTGTPDYSGIGPQEAIGVDNAWTVLHIPLKHPLLSESSGGFKLNPKRMEQKSSRRGKENVSGIADREPFRKDKQTPIAILSILSSTIPYPSNLRYSLEHLAPQLATSFSLCRHYSTLESEVHRMHHRRPRVAGFGAVDPDGRPITDPAILSYASEEMGEHSLTGSLTSPSDYSTQSRSAAGTPGWEAAGFGVAAADKRPAVPSPAIVGGDSYFTTKPKTAHKTESLPAQQRVRRGSRGSATSEKRSSLRLAGTPDLSPGAHELDAGEDAAGKTPEDTANVNTPKRLMGKDVLAVQKEEHAVEGRVSSMTQTPHRHKKLHSYGGDFAMTFQSLPPGTSIPSRNALSRTESTSTNPPEMPWPTDKLKDLILDALPAQLFIATVPAGGVVWVNSRYIAYRGQTLAELHADPYACIHPDDRETYLSAWGRAVRTGEDFQMSVRIRRFDGAYRCFSARVVACRNRRNEIVYYLGSYTDIHEQTMAELKVVRQQEIEASEAKHRLLANLIPQIIFTATEDEGITFSNEQWLSYTGQREEDALGLGFMDYVHPDDLAKCQVPSQKPPSPTLEKGKARGDAIDPAAVLETLKEQPRKTGLHSGHKTRGSRHNISRQNSSSSESAYGPPGANLTELTKSGVLKIGRDSSGRLTYTTEIRLRSKMGDYRWHLIRCVEIDNASPGSLTNYFGSATDINDHKLLEAKLKEAMESKSRFLSNSKQSPHIVSTLWILTHKNSVP